MTTVRCPCCGSTVSARAMPLAQALIEMRVTPTARRIIELLAQNLGLWVPIERLEFAAWGDAVDGGPENCRSNLKVHLSKSRPALRALGYRIEAEWGGGIPGSQRRLIRDGRAAA